MDHTFYGFTGVTIHLGCWENTRIAYVKLSITNFSHIFPTSRVGYHGGLKYYLKNGLLFKDGSNKKIRFY